MLRSLLLWLLSPPYSNFFVDINLNYLQVNISETLKHISVSLVFNHLTSHHKHLHVSYIVFQPSFCSGIISLQENVLHLPLIGYPDRFQYHSITNSAAINIFILENVFIHFGLLFLQGRFPGKVLSGHQLEICLSNLIEYY